MFPFPPNLADQMPDDLQKKIYLFMLDKYIWPQIMERRPFESQWDKLLDMSRAMWDYDSTDVDLGTRLDRDHQKTILTGTSKNPSAATTRDRIRISDTVIFDAVDRLTNLNHFIAFKNDMPVQYEIPPDMVFPMENDVYSPMSDLVKSANCWLKFNGRTQDFYTKYRDVANHHYTYGVSFVHSAFAQRISSVMRPIQMPGGPPPQGAPGAPQTPAAAHNQVQWQPVPELTDIGVTFEPMSIRRIWLNWRLPMRMMEYQQCPFFFDFTPRFAIVANRYNPQINPLGYGNVDRLQPAQYLFGATETSSMQEAFKRVYPDVEIDLGQLLAPEYNVELKWTFYPMLPFDPTTGEFETRQADGSPVPMTRFIVETFGNTLTTGSQSLIRLQPYFYPEGDGPLYGATHMGGLDDGVYGPAIGSILENHYVQLCKAVLQFLDNKDWINDPPTLIMTGSPAMDKNINDKGERIPVNGTNDVMRRDPLDATGTTPNFIQSVKDAMQTTSKSTDAILGKAMGSRTSATEATNVFQTAMSGVTTDVNIFARYIAGGYASRVWTWSGMFIDPSILQIITGSFGFAIKPEHLTLRLGLKSDIGSTFIEAITRQQNIQWILSQSAGDQTINRAALWNELLEEWHFRDIHNIVNDGDVEHQILLANDQACRTYLGDFVMIDPQQNHQIALKVKTSYLADRSSVWNTTPQYVFNTPKLVQQIQIHQQWIQLQQMQAMLAQRQQMGLDAQGQDKKLLQQLQNKQAASPANSPTTPGQQAQQNQ